MFFSLLQKMDDNMDFLTDFNAVVSLRKRLNLDPKGRREEEDKRRPQSRRSSSASNSSSSDPSSSSDSKFRETRQAGAGLPESSSAPCPYCTTGYSACEDGDYYRHMVNSRRAKGALFTVGEAVRSTCGNSHEEEENNRFHLSLHQTIL